MEIRDERQGEEAAIHELTRIAFAEMPFSDGSEPQIIDQLRKDGDLVISLVALQDEEILGHIAFSPVKIGDALEGWYGLGPISVHPKAQKTGMGRALMEEGLLRLKNLEVEGCVLIGEPAFYRRFGFRSYEGLTYKDVPQKFVQYFSFVDGKPNGEIVFGRAFGG